MLRPEGRIFFANVERIGEKMRTLIAEAKPKVVALHLRGVFDLEYTALKMLTEGEQRFRNTGVLLWLVGLNPGVLAMVQRSPSAKPWATTECSSIWSRRSPSIRRCREPAEAAT